MAACLHRGWLPSLLTIILLSQCGPAMDLEPVTSQDAVLLEEVPEDILCFSRSFEDLTCFWDEDEELNRTQCFYYWYSRDAPTTCAVSKQRRGAGRTRNVCVFPSQDVRLFTRLHVLILDTATNQTQHSRELSVEAVGLIAPPVNISTRWAGAVGQLCVWWQPPLADYPNFFLYEGLVQADTRVVLRDLQPGVRYSIQVRSKPDGTSMDGVWGPWSQAVVAETPRSSGDIGLRCSTPDLQRVCCEWSWDPTEQRGSHHELFYQAPASGASEREDMWQQCEDISVGTQGSHTCTFQPTAGSAVAVLVNVTQPHGLPVLSYFQEPFWPHQAVLTEAPRLVQAVVAQGRLSLQWLPPLEALAEQLEYQVRYSTEGSPDWKVLQVPRAAHKEVLDLRPGARYRAQVRAQPGGPWYGGSWSAWSEPVMVDATAEAGWVIPSVTVVPLVFTGVLLGLRCTFPSLCSSVKQKLWPPVPDLHRALGSFLRDSPRQGQAGAFYKQPPEDAVLPCLLEVLPGPRGDPAEPPAEPAASRPPWCGAAPGMDIANQSYLLVGGWEPRGPP